MGPRTLCYFKTRMVWNTKNAKNLISSELYAHKQTAFQWFHSSKAFNNTRDHRTYAQVAKNSNCNSKPNMVHNHVDSDPRIVTVSNNKVKPKIVTPSKVSVNAKGCTSPNRPSYAKTRVQTIEVGSHAHPQGFLTNRFQILTDLDDSLSNPYNDTGDSEGELQPFNYKTTEAHHAGVQAFSEKASDKPMNGKSSRVHVASQNINFSTSPCHANESTDTFNESTNISDISRVIQEPSTNQNHTLATNSLQKTQKHVAKHIDCHSDKTLQQIPLYVWQNKYLSRDHMACLAQNGGDFGYIPLNDLKIYEGPDIVWEKIPDIIEAHKIIRNSGVPNFLKSRIPVPTQLNPQRWYFHLQDYWDKQLPDLINYGFPLDFDRNSILQPTYQNHTSAIQHKDQIEKYIIEELNYGAIYGPFQQLPFPVHISPLMTRPKQNTDKRRTIMDLSWPKGASINSSIHKFRYLDTYFSLSYPSIDHIVREVKNLGPGSLLYKVDISRAFRHLRIDPGDIDLLGILHKDLFLDGSLPFGFRLGSGFFERCSDAIRFIMKKHNHNALLNYIDDLIYIGLPSKIHQSYQFLLSLLKDLGLEVSDSKLVPPSTCVTCLGIQVDTVNKTLSIPEEKLQEIKSLCQEWTHKRVVTKQQYQSLLGSLLYISKCIKPARIFLNRMLQVLRSHHNSTRFKLTPEFFQDLCWFNTFLHQYNGVTYFDNRISSHVVHLDASLTGMGATFANMVYALPIPSEFHHLHITQLEMLNVIVALKVWASAWSDRTIDIKCDNLAVVEVLTSGKTKDTFLATCARNIWLLCAIFNINIRVHHIPGKSNNIADLLSRWNVTKDPLIKLYQLLPQFIWINTHVDLMKLNHDI